MGELLRLPAVVPGCTSLEGETCLHIAARQGYLGVLETVCEALPLKRRKKLALLQRDDGKTATELASDAGRDDIALLFETLFCDGDGRSHSESLSAPSAAAKAGAAAAK